MLTTVLDEALRTYGRETPRLRLLPENRYNRGLFPAQGQYDWFSGQALYCLVRHLRPQQVVEISCANGYSSLFMALALRENASGMLETFELSVKNARCAQENFCRFGVEACVRVHVGDARRTVGEIILEKTDLLFLDSLHSEAFARWYLEALLPRLGAQVPVHIHDILPRHARVRSNGGPPFPGGWTVSWRYRTAMRVLHLFGRFAATVLPGRFELAPVPATSIHFDGRLLTYDGNRFSEAHLVNQAVELLARDDYAYLYDLADGYPELGPRDYDSKAGERRDACDRPREWNESFWCYAGPLTAAYRAVQAKAAAPALPGKVSSMAPPGSASSPLTLAVARSLVKAQNALLVLLAQTLFRRQPTTLTTILVFRSSAIGDFICALPALQRLRQRFPQSRIVLLTTPTGNPRYWRHIQHAGGAVLDCPQLVDEVLCFRSYELLQPGPFLKLRQQVRRLDPGLTFLLPFTGEPFLNRLKKIVLLRLLGVRRNLEGYEMRSSLGFFRQAQFLHGAFPHQVVSALAAVDGTEEAASSEVVFPLSEDGAAECRAKDLWASLGLDGRQPVVALAPGARFEHKRWPLENFLALCRRLLDEFPVRLVVVGGAEDQPLGAALAETNSARVHNLAGRTTLPETAAVLRRCTLFIGNDSGPAHLAAAVGTPCVTVFSSVVFPGIWEPWGERNVALRHPVPCEFCFSEGHCPTGTRECIRGISVERVLAAACLLLGAGGLEMAGGRQRPRVTA